MVEHASTLVYCCFLIWSVTAAAVLLIVLFLVITCKAHEVFMLLQTSTHEILSAIGALKEISCGSCALHVITKYGTTFFASSTAAAITEHIEKKTINQC